MDAARGPGAGVAGRLAQLVAALAQVVGVGVNHQGTADYRILASQRDELVLKQQGEKR